MKKLKINYSEIEKIAKLFKLISDENRARILKLLFEKDCFFVDILDKLNIEKSLLSFHLSKLLEENLIINERDRKNVLYSIDPDTRLKDRQNGFDLGFAQIIYKGA